MRNPIPLIIFTFALTATLLPASTAQLAQQLSDGQIQVPTSLAPLTTAPAPKVAVPTGSPPLPAPIESATTLALPPSSTAAVPPPPPPTLAAETTAPVPPPPNEAAETLPSPPPVTANINVTYTSTSSCTGTGSGTGSGALVAGNTTVSTVPSVPSVAAPASTEGGPSEAGTTAPTASNVGARVGWGGVGGAVVGVVLLWNL